MLGKRESGTAAARETIQVPETAPPETAAEPALPRLTKLLFAFGAVASAVKQRALATFLMLFYNQVVGLPPELVSTGLGIALVFDGFVDPLVGQISDNFRSRLGRRHPFMYASAVPVTLAFFLLWNPPVGWGQGAVFAWMLTTLLTVRLFDTFFELPSSALVPELAKDYEERTSLVSLRGLFATVSGLGMTVVAYRFFLRENADGTGGVLARDGYFAYSAVMSLLIVTSIVVSTIGTHSRIPHLRPAPRRKATLGTILSEGVQTLSNRSFAVLTVAGIFIAIAAAARSGLELYFGLYFWELTQRQLADLTTVGVGGSLLGVAIAPVVARRLGKRLGSISTFAGALAIGTLPVPFRLLGWMPDNGTPLLFQILVAETFVNTALAVATGVILVSMVADVVEEVEVKTGRRSEGLLFSADNLCKKIVSGVGVAMSGLVLKWIAFPTDAKPGAVDPDLLFRLGVVYLPVITSLYAIGMFCLFAFDIDRARHEDNLRKLRELNLDQPTPV